MNTFTLPINGSGTLSFSGISVDRMTSSGTGGSPEAEKLFKLFWQVRKCFTETTSRIEVLAELEAVLAECAEDNWDGYGAMAVDRGSYRHALRFLEHLPSAIPSPEVGVDPDGELSFEWAKGPRWLFSVSVGRDGELSYAGLFGKRSPHGTEHLEDEVPKSILRGVRKVLS